MIRGEIEKTIRQAIEELKRDLGDFSIKEIPLEHPGDSGHGDYATSVAFVIAKQIGKRPQEIAQKIAETIINQQSAVIERVMAVEGFVNFFISQEYLLQELEKVQKQKDEYGKSNALKAKKIMMEFTDPNPFKEFHIGHLYSNIVGETISRLLEASGAQVKRANYQGDVGMHVAKAIWGMQKKMQEENISLSDLAKKSLQERVEFLGQSYALGTRVYEENEETKKEIAGLNKKIFEQDKGILELYEKGRKWSLEKFEEIYKRLGTKFDYYHFERDAAKKGLEIVREGLKKGIFQESEGAVIFPGEKYGLHSRVFINSQGLSTYEAKELGLAPTKYKDFPYDFSIIVTGNEIVEYFKVLIAALKQMYPNLGEKTLHLSHGMVRLPQGKMSSRTGTVITAEDLLDEVKTRARTLTDASGVGLLEKEKEEVAEKVALAAVKYSLLRVSIGKDIVFDFEKSLSLEGDSGPYLLYTYARCKSILRKSQIPNSKFQINPKIQISKEELDLLRTIYRLPEVVQEAAEKYAPNMVCGFAFDLAQKYNAFYNMHRVLEANTKEQKEFRFLLTAACAQLLQNSLHLLGIQTLEKM